MDALSQIVEELHISETQYAHLRGRGDWRACIESPHILFYLMIEGECVIQPDDAPSMTLHTGDLMMLTQGYPHHVHSSSDNATNMPVRNLTTALNTCHDDIILGQFNDNGTPPTCHLLCFQCHVDVDMSRPLLTALPMATFIDHTVQTHATEWTQYVFQFLTLETSAYKIGRDTLINRLTGLILVESIRYHIEHLSDDSESWLLVFQDPALFQVMNAIHQQVNRAWTVAELASIAHMSRSTFAERFSQKIGMPPLTYLYKHRLRKAAYYLRKTNQSSALIGEKLGYASESSFCLSFKKHYGMTPSHYRKNHQHVVPTTISDE